MQQEEQRLYEHLYERLERRVESMEADIKALHGRITKLEEFRKMVQVALLTVFAVVTYVSSEGWELLRKLFVRQ